MSAPIDEIVRLLLESDALTPIDDRTDTSYYTVVAEDVEYLVAAILGFAKEYYHFEPIKDAGRAPHADTMAGGAR